ncbi:hypothetical protein PanWU01x14_275780 [Parasponia andersonii]|uniref:Uncharacterized protein n=1 Tax=Parasponia andersonii TaxID=3476 RepID=A0A2P5B375_PARAD|nr:hypothetical protein PanWU01x14_275780 [Parasponia andersonii]
MDREWQMDLDDGAAGARDVGLYGFLDGLEGAVEDEDGVVLGEEATGEGAADVVEDDGGSGGGVVEEGDLVDVVCIDEVLDKGAGAEEGGAEGVEVEVVGLAEEPELPGTLDSEYGFGAATEAAVVDSGDTREMVGELLADIGEEAGLLSTVHYESN